VRCHGIKAGIEQVRQEMKHVVEKKEFYLDSKEPSMDLKAFLRGEVRYAALEAAFPENAETLFGRRLSHKTERAVFNDSFCL